MRQLYLGIDFGTSGARAVVIDAEQAIQAQSSISFPSSDLQQGREVGEIWQQTLFDLIAQIPATLRQAVRAVAINGTSSTVLICDEQGRLFAPPLLYNDDRGVAVLEQVKAIAPPQHPVISATSSLTKLLWFIETKQNHKPENQFNPNAQPSQVQSPKSAQSYFLHQADWLSFLLHGKLGISDYHNALKLGYDVGELCYPAWLLAVQTPFQLPQVVVPGTPIAPVQPDIATKLGLALNCIVCAGTTDSIAAFLASGAKSPGEAVTSLGSTLVLKLLSDRRVDDAQYGIYSHRLGALWLVGGASNTGGAVLRQFFTDAQLQQYSDQIVVDRPSPLAYYPLLKPGERFPINDPALPPCLEPRPDSPIEFLHGLLESMARIEANGYQLLQGLGATPLTRVYTAGGGAKNAIWGNIRSRHLKVPVLPSAHVEAAYGTALLARTGLTSG
jgi:sugar (pentulose or hexulose) kinase